MKFRLISLIIITFSILSAQTPQTDIDWPTLTDSPWPVVRGDFQGTGRSRYEGPKTANVIWEKSFPLGILDGPAIGENGNLYFGASAGNTTFENYFYCTDSLGNLIWTFNSNSWLSFGNPPAISSDNKIYVGSYHGTFYSINEDGTLNWKYSSGLTFANNVLIDLHGNIYTADESSLYCFSSEGEILWEKEFQLLNKSLAFSPSGDTLYAAEFIYNGTPETNIYTLFALNLDGDVIWEKDFYWIKVGSILVDNQGLIYILANETGESKAMICLNRDSSVKWKYEIEVGNVGGPTMDYDGNIFFYGSTPEYSGIVSLDHIGNLRWLYKFEKIDGSTEEIQQDLVCDADGTIYAGSALGYYYYAISNKGELIWKLPLNGLWADSPPAIGKDGAMYMGLHNGFFGKNLEKTLIAIKDEPNSVDKDDTPTEFTLSQNYPNPFNPSTKIKFAIPLIVKRETSNIKLIVYDILGREVKTLINKNLSPGNYEVEFNASNLPSGVYFYRLTAGSFVETRKMILLR